MKAVASALLGMIAVVLGVALYAISGLYDVAATAPHTRPVFWLVETVRSRSIHRHADDIPVPTTLADEARVTSGAEHFSAHCAVCHGAPDADAAALARGMYPEPPSLRLARSRYEPNELFWIIKNGIKLTGMPAWSDHGDDEIWNTVAFLQKLPDMGPEEYRRMAAAKDGSSRHRPPGRGPQSQDQGTEHRDHKH